MSGANSSSSEFDHAMQRLADGLADVESRRSPAEVEVARSLLRATLDLHRAGLAELLAVLREGPTRNSTELLEALGRRTNVAHLLAMHDLHPIAVDVRIARALALAGETLARGASAELVSMDGVRAHVRIVGRDGASAVALRHAVERLVTEHAPDAELVVEGGEPGAAEPLVPVERLTARGRGAEP